MLRRYLGRYLGLLAVLTGLPAFGQPSAQQQQNAYPNRPAKTKVSFELYRDYLIVVHGSAGPLKGLNFLVDTGATPSILGPQLAKRLHLNAAPVEIPVLNGNVQGGMAILSSLQLGPIHKENLRVLIEDLSFIQRWLPFQIDGIVGLDVLGKSAFVIDYAAHEIRFGPTPPMPMSVPLQMTGGLPIVDAIVNSTSIHLLFDTGAPSLVLFEHIPGPGLQAASAQSPGSIGSFDPKLVRQIRLKLGETEFGSKPAVIVRNQRDAGHDFDGLMSPAALGITRVAVDPGDGTLSFTREP
jgi:hypothetical protein